MIILIRPIIYTTIGKACLQELHRTNSPLTMAVCGSKGSNINISQMIACVGQQAISGHRTPDGFEGRSLPHFKQYSKIPAAKGFVENSFFSGLTPTEFFFHTMAGREGLVDTAVKTAETGYMQRRLVKSLEDLSLQYDYTVRSSMGDIIQFIYGEDGMDPACMEGKDKPLDIGRIFEHCRCLNPCIFETSLRGNRIMEIVEDLIAQNKHLQGYIMLVSDIKDHFKKLAGRVDVAFDRAQAAGHSLDKVLDRSLHVTESLLQTTLQVCTKKAIRAKCEPGTAVGMYLSLSLKTETVKS